MKIEFRKVPFQEKKFNSYLNSVKIEGTFCKISTNLVKIEAKLVGKVLVNCYRCGVDIDKDIDEDISLLVSDGIFNKSEDSEDIVIEIDNHIIDFNYIIQSEIESYKSDYHICNNCENDNNLFEKEF